MKKFFLLFITLCSLSLVMNAQTPVTVQATGDNYTVTIGDVTVSDVAAVAYGDVNVLAINRDGVSLLVRFTDVDTLVADGVVNGTAVHYASPAAITRADDYQIPNSDFEAWDKPTGSGEPNNWHGFKSATGNYASWAKGTLASSTDVRPGSTGTKSALITAGNVFGIVNNGTMTNGRLKAGSMSAANTDNHSEMQSSAKDYFTALKAAPDAITTWLKATISKSSDMANISTIVFDGSYYQDPEDKTYTNVAAKAKNSSISKCDWTQFTIPFDYDTYADNNAAAAAILVTISTNATPGAGTSGDKVYVDDMALIYNGGVTDITATALGDFTFDAATHHYDLVGNYGNITADDFTVTTDGKAATVVKNVEDLGCGNYRITLGAYSADMLAGSVYTITVANPMFMLGSFNGWDTETKEAMTYDQATQTYTLTKALEAGAEFKLMDAAGTWIGGKNDEVTKQDVVAATALELVYDYTGKNFRIPVAGEWTFTVSPAAGTLTIAGEWPIDNVWMMGNVNGNEWASNVGVLMTYNEEDGTYTADVTATDTAWFSFTKRLAQTEGAWDEIASYRFGANTEGANNDFVMREMYLGQELELAADGNFNAFELPAGEWKLTIKNLDGERTLIITGEWPAPIMLVQGSFNDWSTEQDMIVMTATEGKYVAAYTSQDAGDGYSYFRFVKRVAGEQDVVMGAVSDGDFLVTAQYLATPLELTTDAPQAYKIPAGEFDLTVDPEAMTLTIDGTLVADGDLTGDGTVDVDDVNMLIGIILGKVEATDCASSPNVSGDADNTIDVDDVNALIAIILNK